MNYRHAYHAGNFADVVKHAVLALILDHLGKKEAPFFVLDSHAGIGRYDLQASEAQKTLEFQAGIARLLAQGPLPAELAGYERALARVNPDWPALSFYPGSPSIARSGLRSGDRLALAELHPEDARRLKAEFRDDGQVGVHAMDGYQAMKALLPPREKRGLVLIDPPFESEDEFQRMTAALGEALDRWPGGIYALWYPIKTEAAKDRFLAEIVNFARPALVCELLMRPPADPSRLNGCGLAIVNPPYRLDETVGRLLPGLALALGATGKSRLDWLVPSP